MPARQRAGPDRAITKQTPTPPAQAFSFSSARDFFIRAMRSVNEETDRRRFTEIK
jgi:hypothetical protein